MGVKSADIHGVYACYSCHLNLDSNKVSKSDQLAALLETQIKLIIKELITLK